MLFTIIAIPFWSATTDAYAKHDVKWIRSSVRKLNLIVLSMLLIIIVMTLASPFVYNIWVGSGVKTNMMLSGIMGAYIFVIVFSLSLAICQEIRYQRNSFGACHREYPGGYP